MVLIAYLKPCVNNFQINTITVEEILVKTKRMSNKLYWKRKALRYIKILRYDKEMKPDKEMAKFHFQLHKGIKK